MRDLLEGINFDRLESLPKGKIFDDAKRIDGIFNKSKHSWNETIEMFEKNKSNGNLKYVKIEDIEITQPNIQSNKVKNIIKNLNDVPLINLVEFKDGKKLYLMTIIDLLLFGF